MAVEFDLAPSRPRGCALQLQLLGPLTIRRDGVVLALPTSRKVRGLIAYLALAPRAPTRAHLCELLGDIANDPRGELRWCLSKVRGIVDEPGRRRLQALGDDVCLDLSDCFVDAAEIDSALHGGLEKLDVARLRSLAALFAGDFLDALELDRSPRINSWLTGQRRRMRAGRVAVLEQLVAHLEADSEEAVGCLEQWLALAPFDRGAHHLLLATLARRGCVRDGDEHLAAAARLHEAEGLDWRPLRDAWQDAKARHTAAPAAVAPVAGLPDPLLQLDPEPAPRRASISVMPFVDQLADSPVRGGMADGLAHDIITRLAKLRCLFVIAQGTVFSLAERPGGAQQAGRALNVDYVVSGSVRRQPRRLLVNVELVETATARVVWAEAFDHALDDVFLVLDEIGDRIVASIAGEIEAVERNRAILMPPNSLGAWEAHHRGLWHMYRFNQADNDRARHFFEMAVRLDPTFSRAHAGLSFTHFQNAFQHWTEPGRESDRAFAAAEQSLTADARDPAAHWAMGRALWLRGRDGESLVELGTAVESSPNFALGHYALAFVHGQSGDAEAAIRSSDLARRLSPYDPLMFGMLGTRAFALARLGRFDEAADAAVKAASCAHAHVHITAIAACCVALAGRLEEAHRFVATIHTALPQYRVDDFLTTFRYAADAEALFRGAAERIGLA